MEYTVQETYLPRDLKLWGHKFEYHQQHRHLPPIFLFCPLSSADTETLQHIDYSPSSSTKYAKEFVQYYKLILDWEKPENLNHYSRRGITQYYNITSFRIP